MNNDKQILLNSITKIHTTEMGLLRIVNNLSLKDCYPVEWCKLLIKDESSCVTRKGKNWYVTLKNNIITININSLTIITAHKKNDIKERN